MNSSAHKRQWGQRLRTRMVVVWCLVLVCFGLALFQAGRLQVVQRERLAELARRQYTGAVTLMPRRGDIVDIKGRKLASSVEVYSLYAEPRRVEEPKQLARKLASLLYVDYGETYRKLSSDRGFVWIQRKLTPYQKAEVLKLGAPGLGFVPEAQRYYPNQELAAHALGFVGMDDHGLEGLELLYDQVLRGEEGRIRVHRDRLGRTVSRHEAAERPEQTGLRLVLTLDKTIQYRMERALRDAVIEHKARAGLGVMMEPATGEILGMAVYPSYDPNRFREFSASTRRNRVVVDAFEPGSTMKVFTAALALDNGLIGTDELIYCENGRFQVGGHTVRDTHKHGWLTLPGIIQVSSNIGALKVGMRMKKNLLYSGLTQFGFGSPTGVDLPGECRGILRPENSWATIDFATIAFGQGVSISPIQQITALCAIANGGALVRPRMVRRIEDRDGNVVQTFEPEIMRRVISREAAENMAVMLQKVVREGGTGTRAAIQGYSVAGKTGTAQKVDPRTRSYSRTDFVSSFMGFFPDGKPPVALLVMIDEPRKSVYGGLVAAPVFRNIMEHVIPYMGVKPQGVYLVQRQIDSAAAPAREPFPVIHPAESASSLDAESGVMPYLLGLDVRSALSILSLRGVEISLQGGGSVIRQEPAPGVSLKGVEACTLILGEGEDS